jgi:uncharacterized membrane protein YphA (DoxX/SURF4 family)
MTIRSTEVIYRMATGFTVIAFATLGVANLARVPAVLEGVTHLGYPAYLSTILGIWQLLGAAAIAAPVTPRLKEWAYAGMVFNLTGAAESHVASADFARALVPLALLGVVMASWALRSARTPHEGYASAGVPLGRTA